jgi:hypothetical protein
LRSLAPTIDYHSAANKPYILRFLSPQSTLNSYQWMSSRWLVTPSLSAGSSMCSFELESKQLTFIKNTRTAYQEIIKLVPHFLDRGCDPNRLSWSGKTPSDAIRPGNDWMMWKVVLAKYGSMVCHITNGKGTVHLVVNADISTVSAEEGFWIDLKNDKQILDIRLPVTSLIIRKWTERRFLQQRRRLLGTLSLLPLRAEELEVLRDLDFETILDCALDDIHNFFNVPSKYLTGLGACWHAVLEGHMETYGEGEGEIESYNEWETSSWEEQTDEEL